jgi:hypothetical protein
LKTGNLIKKVYFPREILPLSVVTSEAVNFLISTLIILGFILAYGLGITKFVILYPVILLIQYILCLGLSLIVSSVTVFFRDLQHFIGVILQLLFYATPIVYSIQTIPEQYRWILKINPMTYIIEGYRDIFYNQCMPDMKMLGIVLAIGIATCIIGYIIFNKLQKKFAEEL